MITGAAKPDTLHVWMRAIRIFSFTASVTPVLAGSAFALCDDQFSLLLFPLILVACVLVHAGCNLANDYFDYGKGVDDESTVGRGGVIQDGWLSQTDVRNGMIACFVVATLLGLIILAASTWWLLLLTIPSLLAAIFYTGGSRPLGYISLGELTVWVFMGMGIVGGTYAAMTKVLTWEVVVGSLGLSALVSAILHVNNIRDFDTDRVAGKRTLAHVLGRSGAIREFTTLIVFAFVFTGVLILFWPENWPTALVLVVAPAAVALVRLVRTHSDVPTLNQGVRLTAQLHFRFGLLLTLGLLVRAFITWIDGR